MHANCRGFALGLLAALAALTAGQAEPTAAKVEIKNVHLCCKHTVDRTHAGLTAVPGLTDVKCDLETKTVTFLARDEKAAQAGIRFLTEEGFCVQATMDGKALASKVVMPAAGAKADLVTVRDVHVCCKPCQNAITDLFRDAKVSFAKQGVRRDVLVSGKDLDKAQVLETLNKAGFTGKVK